MSCSTDLKVGTTLKLGEPLVGETWTRVKHCLSVELGLSTSLEILTGRWRALIPSPHLEYGASMGDFESILVE